MEMKTNHIYEIKDKFFEDFKDPNLMYNKNEKRPHYYVFESPENKGISWVVPMSSQTEKFERIIKNKTEKGRPADIAHVCNVGGRKQAFVIQSMFPVSNNYVKKNFMIDDEPYKVVSKNDIDEINKKASRIKMLIDKGIKFLPNQVDTKAIEEKLLSDQRKERVRNMLRRDIGLER